MKTIKVIKVLLVLLILYFLVTLGLDYYQNYNSHKKLKSIANQVEELESLYGLNKTVNGQQVKDGSNLSLKKEAKPLVNMDQLAKNVINELKNKNEDVVAYIKVKNLGIDYPVMWVKDDNDYYLHRDIDERWSLPGSIFMNGWNRNDFSDMNTTLFGHKMRTRTTDYPPMFKALIDLEDSNKINPNEDQIIEIYTPEGYKRYQIFSVYHTDIYNDYIKENFDRKTWVEYLNELRNKSSVKFNYDKPFDITDKIITLSTCDVRLDIYRVAVHAVELKDNIN